MSSDRIWVDPSMTEMTATHLIYDGEGGWISAKAVHIDMPHPEVDGAVDGPGWQFNSAHDLIRWLRS